MTYASNDRKSQNCMAPALTHMVMSNYTDYSEVPDDILMDLSSPSAPMYGLSPHDALLTLQNSFPCKLHAMLEDMENSGSDVVSWCVHGRAFKIRDQKRFVSEILPCYFRQTQYPSFQRQLNLYGFSRLTAGADKGAYFNEKFLRGRPMLALKIKRIRRKGQGPRKPGRPEMEPNFYQMAFLPNKRANQGPSETGPDGEAKEKVPSVMCLQPLVQPQPQWQELYQPEPKQQQPPQEPKQQQVKNECCFQQDNPKGQLLQSVSSLRSMMPNVVASTASNYNNSSTSIPIAANLPDLEPLRRFHARNDDNETNDFSSNNFPLFTTRKTDPTSFSWPYPEISRDCSSPLFWDD